MSTLERIREIIATKKAARREPAHALFYAELLLPGCDAEALKQELRQLYRQGEIKAGHTINDFFITLHIH